MSHELVYGRRVGLVAAWPHPRHVEADPMATANDACAQAETAHLLAEDLIRAAQSESDQSSRSRLAPCGPVLSILREKGWSFAAITTWLDQHGVHVAESTVQRFYRSQQRRNAKRRETVRHVPADLSSTALANPTHETHDSQAPRRTARSADRPKYNTDF